MAANMEVHMVADMEVDKVADKKIDIVKKTSSQSSVDAIDS